jgi:hypothetical protein
MTHKKNYGDKEKFYQDRQRKQPHLDGGANPLLDTADIISALTSLQPEQIVCLATLLFNSYEHEHKHIWFSKGIRERTITDIAMLIEALESNIFESSDLPELYTGMGINDHKRKYE